MCQRVLLTAQCSNWSKYLEKLVHVTAVHLKRCYTLHTVKKPDLGDVKQWSVQWCFTAWEMCLWSNIWSNTDLLSITMSIMSSLYFSQWENFLVYSSHTLQLAFFPESSHLTLPIIHSLFFQVSSWGWGTHNSYTATHPAFMSIGLGSTHNLMKAT